MTDEGRFGFPRPFVEDGEGPFGLERPFTREDSDKVELVLQRQIKHLKREQEEYSEIAKSLKQIGFPSEAKKIGDIQQDVQDHEQELRRMMARVARWTE